MALRASIYHARAMTTPKIEKLLWGRIEIGDLVLKDAKVFPGGARAWDWNETGTRHSPGIQPADCEELIEHGADIVVLTRGQELVLQVPAETIQWLEERGVEVVVDETNAAVEKLHELIAAGRKVGGLFHSTC
jgi:hypothetical protein